MASTNSERASNQVMNFSMKHLFYGLMSVLGLVALCYMGKSIVVPIALGLLLSFILYPVCKFLESKIKTRAGSVFITFMLLTILIVGVVLLFSAQAIEIVKEFGDFRSKMYEMLAMLTKFINEKILVTSDISEQEIVDASKEWVANKSGKLVEKTLSNTSSILFDLVLIAIYTFLFLLYRTGLKKAFVNFAADEKKQAFTQMLNQMQKVGQNYLSGMFIVILILGILNSVGLLVLGIEYAFFFGFMAAVLAIIPYVGTIIGGAIPTLFAFMTYDSLLYPLGVIGVFWAVQTLEGNFLSPKIVGGKLSLNPLMSIIGLIVGSLIWGIPGMILSLPYLAILKVACDHYEQLRPVGYLLGNEIESGKPQKTSFIDRLKKVFK